MSDMARRRCTEDGKRCVLTGSWPSEQNVRANHCLSQRRGSPSRLDSSLAHTRFQRLARSLCCAARRLLPTEPHDVAKQSYIAGGTVQARESSLERQTNGTPCAIKTKSAVSGESIMKMTYTRHTTAYAGYGASHGVSSLRWVAHLLLSASKQLPC